MHFCQGRVVFWGAIFLFFGFGQGEGHFCHMVTHPSFSLGGGGSPLLGEKRAFLAEPSARPAINGRLDEKWGMNKMRIKKTKTTKKKKWEKKSLSYIFHKVRRFQPGREKSTR